MVWYPDVTTGYSDGPTVNVAVGQVPPGVDIKAVTDAVRASLSRIAKSSLPCTMRCIEWGIELQFSVYRLGNGGIMLRYSEVECAQPETLDQLMRHRIGHVLRDLAMAYYLK